MVDNRTVGDELIKLVHEHILPTRGIKNDRCSIEVTRKIVEAWEKGGRLETLYERMKDPTRQVWLAQQVDQVLQTLPALPVAPPQVTRSRSCELAAGAKVPSPITRQQSKEECSAEASVPSWPSAAADAPNRKRVVRPRDTASQVPDASLDLAWAAFDASTGGKAPSPEKKPRRVQLILSRYGNGLLVTGQTWQCKEFLRYGGFTLKWNSSIGGWIGPFGQRHRIIELLKKRCALAHTAFFCCCHSTPACTPPRS